MAPGHSKIHATASRIPKKIAADISLYPDAVIEVASIALGPGAGGFLKTGKSEALC